MKQFCFLLLLLTSSTVLSAQIDKDSSKVLPSIVAVDKAIATDVKKLTAYLIKPANNDSEKLQRLYQWVIHNISYDTAALNNKRINHSNQDILNRKKAICWGYATLLKAMCDQAGIPAIIITGYAKNSFQKAPFLKYPNHAWNAVQINEEWQLVDATWDSGLLGKVSEFDLKFQQDYYCTPPKYFLTNHLPTIPQWQLIDCPIQVADFALAPDTIVQLAQSKDCSTTQNALQLDIYANDFERRLYTAINAYQFNPTDNNRRELAHAQIEYQEYLSDLADQLQVDSKIDSLLLLQTQMIDLCETASALTTLFDTQLENCAYNYFNYAVALSQVELTTDNEEQILTTMLTSFQKARIQLEGLQQNIFIEQALEQCKGYIEYLEERLEK